MNNHEIDKPQISDKLKKELKALGLQDLIRVTKIRSAEKNNVMRIETKNGNYILKEGPNLLNEKESLDWLVDKLPVPKVINWQNNGEQQKLLMSYIEGEDLAKLSKKISKEELVRLLADSLKLVHSISTINCPFGKHNKNSVFIHGDACLPNFIFHQGKLSGIIDLGSAGIGDKEIDLAAAVWSLNFNLGPGLGVPFLTAYGLKSPTNKDVDRLIQKYENDKPIKDAVSVVIKNTTGEVLFALRNKNEKSFPLVWSLPSHFVKDGDNFDETIKKIGQDKLGVELKLVKLLNEGQVEREEFILFMHDFSAKIVSGTPHISSEDHYEELKWEKPEKQLLAMKEMGECCRLYKEYLHL